MQSFYASVEVATRAEYLRRRFLEADDSDPALAVTGDPKRRSGIILAATPAAKACGVSTAMRLGEALHACPSLVYVPPRMQLYIDTSVRIHETVRQTFPKYEPFSVDECFFAFPSPSDLFPDPVQAAADLRTRIWNQFRIRSRVGLAPNKWAAKMANKAAKKVSGGVLWWRSQENVLDAIHPLPVTDMWGLKRRAATLQAELGCSTIGDVARLPLGRLRARFGVWGEVIHRWANGLDYSELNTDTMSLPHQGYSHRTTLPRDYTRRDEVTVVILELLDEVCTRARQAQQKGRRIGLGLTYASLTGGFYKAKTLPFASNHSEALYSTLLELLDRHWDLSGVRAVSVSLDQLGFEDGVQLNLLEDILRRQALWATVDEVRRNYGETSLMRLSSLLPAGQLRERAHKIGGHTA
ncbi:DNA polymerase IV [Alicyclobacillaceae bacterium I2511]|nr:DNA polymerase IV [Alicyclobacillaceae bacterium I2511]